MKRTLVFVVAALLIGGAAFAQCGMMGAAPAGDDQVPMRPCMRGAQQGMMMRQGPIANMAGALDTAVWGDYVYVLQGNMLEKRDMDGNAVKSVALEDMEQTMDGLEDAGMCPMCGMPMDMEMRGGCPGAAEGMPCPTCPGMGMGMGGGMGGQGMMHGREMGMSMQGMHGMQRGKMMACVRLQADANGVYLLRGGMFTSFDHDLNKVKSWSAISEECMNKDNACECAMKQMHKSKCPTCRMMMGTMQDQRGIANGMVTMWHRPARLSAGMARLQVQVNEAGGMGDGDAMLTGYLYPKDDVSAGMGVSMQTVGGGTFYGMVDIPGAGTWELALRVKRPGMEDAKLYYHLDVQ